MIKFEEHEGELFRMLDKPVPLIDDAELPALVRMIHDDTMIGKANKRICHQDELAQKIICINLTDGLFINGNYAYRYEIIGYPVAEGSKDWALYQMMQGKKVYHEFPSIVYCKHAGDIRREMIYNCVDYMSVSAWLNRAYENGWQIYHEPKPESQYKVGDWVEWSEGLGISCQSQITRVSQSAVYSKGICIPLRIITKKLKPSEVVVKIGCLSGTVRRINDIFFCLNPSTEKGWVVPEATIPLAMLDTTTAELVRELLKAQEEEK